MNFSRTFGYPDDVIAERFWSRVRVTATCWVWRGRTTRKGYGYMRVKPSGRPWAWMPAHRIAYQLLVGPIPAGLVLDHVWPICQSKLCVRP